MRITSTCKVVTFWIAYLNMKIDHKECGVSKTLKVIGSKWTLLIVRDLCDGTKRFGELQTSLSGISPRTLSTRLKQLEKDHIIKKKVYAQVPPKVEYTLTEKGKTLKKLVEDLRVWGEQTS